MEIFTEYSQKLSVQDLDDSRTQQGVVSSGTLAFLEACGQLMDLKPFSNVLQRKHEIQRAHN